jgi:acetyl esterase/lipase
MVPANVTQPLPVVAWAHGTTGIVSGCAPSIDGPFANVPAVPDLLTKGWAYVATDYVGLGTTGGHAYLVGREAAYGALDAVKAARQIQEIALDNRTVIWGHSQGGNSALWSGMLAREYAPELDVRGIAAMAPASDMAGLLASAQKTMFGKIVSAYLISAYARAYPDVDESAYVDASSRLLVNDIAGRCVGGLGTLFSVAETYVLPSGGIFSRDPLAGPLGERLTENTPRGPFPMPVLLAQGEDDDLVLEKIQAGYFEGLCKAGQPVEYRRIAGRDHISLVAADSPLTRQLIEWTDSRFAGEPIKPLCPP